jgi:hypothetical protein
MVLSLKKKGTGIVLLPVMQMLGYNVRTNHGQVLPIPSYFITSAIQKASLNKLR